MAGEGGDHVGFWLSFDPFIQQTDAQLNTWKARGVDAFYFNLHFLWGHGGSFRFTGNPASVGAGAEWARQREIRDTNIIARCNARGIETYPIIYLLNAANPDRIFQYWFDDSGWANSTLPELSNVAAMCELYGATGLAFDGEQYAGPGTAWSISGPPAQGQPAATTRAKVRQRGFDMGNTLAAACPGIEIAFYYMRLPESWDEECFRLLGSPNGSTNRTIWNLVDGLIGSNIASLHGWDEGTMKQPNGPASFHEAFKWDVNRIYAHVSRNWFYRDLATTKLNVSRFTWIDDDPNAGSFGSARTAAATQVHWDAVKNWTVGRRFANFCFRPPNGAISGYPAPFNYTSPENYLPVILDTSTVETVDASPPSLSNVATTGNLTTGPFNVSGQARDNFAIKSIRWVNNRGGSGVAQMTWVVESGAYGNTQVWRTDWTITGIPVVQGVQNTVTITCQDIHLREVTHTILAGSGGNPQPTGPPVLTTNAASQVAQTQAVLSGTVNPSGLATDAHFEYGLTDSYGTAAPLVAMGAGTTAVPLSQTITGLTPATTYFYQLVAINSAGQTSRAGGSFTTGAPAGTFAEAMANLPDLRAWWRVGESSGAVVDSSGNNNTGTVAGGVSRAVEGMPGSAGNGAIQLDGTSGRISVPHSTSLNLGNGPYSLIACFKRSSIGSTDAIFDKGQAAYHFYIDSDNKLKAGKADFAWGVESNVAVTDTTIKHMAIVTYDGSQWKMWLDSVDVTGPQTTIVVEDNALPLGIGADVNNVPTPGLFWPGMLDELAICGAVLAPATVTELWDFASAEESQTFEIGQLVETDILHPVGQSGGGGGGAGGGDPFYIRDDSETSTLRNTDELGVLRGPGAAPVGGETVIAIGLLTETDTLFTLSQSKTRLLSQLLETDVLHSVTKAAQFIAIGLLTETDVLHTPAKRLEIGLLEEVNELHAVAHGVPGVLSGDRNLLLDRYPYSVSVGAVTHGATLDNVEHGLALEPD